MNVEQAKAICEYNQWMNLRLYEVCAELSDEDRKLNKDAFFKSIHGTLNHILLGDKVWLGRFEGKLFPAKSLDQILYDSFVDLSNERESFDLRIIDWVSKQTTEQLNSPFHYKSIIGSAQITCKLWKAVHHMFNHQTHHRGQITTLLSQFGKDMGVTDFLGMPGLISVATSE